MGWQDDRVCLAKTHACGTRKPVYKGHEPSQRHERSCSCTVMLAPTAPDSIPGDQRDARGACEADSSLTAPTPCHHLRQGGPQTRQARGAGAGAGTHAPCKHASRTWRARRFASNDDLPFQTRSDDAAWSCRCRPSRRVKRYMLLHGGLIAYPSGSASSYAAAL
jgi:hypothetical protein